MASLGTRLTCLMAVTCCLVVLGIVGEPDVRSSTAPLQQSLSTLPEGVSAEGEEEEEEDFHTAPEEEMISSPDNTDQGRTMEDEDSEDLAVFRSPLKHHSDDREHLKEHVLSMTDFDGAGMGHLRDHLSKLINIPSDFDDLPDQKLIVYFFSLHDFDRNNKLDGIEIMALVSDFHSRESTGSGGTQAMGQSARHGHHHEDEGLLSDEIVPIVDAIMNDYDFDHDGFVTFSEFASDGVNSRGMFKDVNSDSYI